MPRGHLRFWFRRIGVAYLFLSDSCVYCAVSDVLELVHKGEVSCVYTVKHPSRLLYRSDVRANDRKRLVVHQMSSKVEILQCVDTALWKRNQSPDIYKIEDQYHRAEQSSQASVSGYSHCHASPLTPQLGGSAVHHYCIHVCDRVKNESWLRLTRTEINTRRSNASLSSVSSSSLLTTNTRPTLPLSPQV